jgi:hypothetical protein
MFTSLDNYGLSGFWPTANPMCSMVLVYLPTKLADFVRAPWSIWVLFFRFAQSWRYDSYDHEKSQHEYT